MQWIAPTEKDTATSTLEKSLWDAADQFRANSGLNAAQYAQPILGLIFLRFAEVRFTIQYAKLEKGSTSSRRGSRIDDPACGSGGMFVSSPRFVSEHKKNPASELSIHGVEKTDQTPAEEALWELLRNRQLENLKFRRQHQIGDYIVDFFCSEYGLIVKLDFTLGGEEAEAKMKDVFGKKPKYGDIPGLCKVASLQEI